MDIHEILIAYIYEILPMPVKRNNFAVFADETLLIKTLPHK